MILLIPLALLRLLWIFVMPRSLAWLLFAAVHHFSASASTSAHPLSLCQWLLSAKNRSGASSYQRVFMM
jgi:hypothetical protein